MKKYLATAAVALLALSGCGSDTSSAVTSDANTPSVKVGNETDLGDYKSVRTVVVQVDGTDVTCVVYAQGSYKGGGGIDCDWENITGAKQ